MSYIPVRLRTLRHWKALKARTWRPAALRWIETQKVVAVKAWDRFSGHRLSTGNTRSRLLPTNAESVYVFSLRKWEMNGKDLRSSEVLTVCRFVGDRWTLKSICDRFPVPYIRSWAFRTSGKAERHFAWTTISDITNRFLCIYAPPLRKRKEDSRHGMGAFWAVSGSGLVENPKSVLWKRCHLRVFKRVLG